MKKNNINFIDIMCSFNKNVKLEEKELKKFYWEKDGYTNAREYKIFALGFEEYILNNNLIEGGLSF